MGTEDSPVKEAWNIFQRVAEDWDSCLEKGTTPDHEELQRIFSSMELVLRAYCLPKNFQHGEVVEDFPPPLAKFLANQIAYIKAGYLPSPIKDILRPGGPGVGPHEKKDIGLAVAYIKAVREKIASDKHPVKTVSKYYGVTDRAVRRWQEKYSDVEPSGFFPNISDNELGEYLTHGMKQAGVRYKQAGRGSVGRFNFPRPNKKQPPEQKA